MRRSHGYLTAHYSNWMKIVLFELIEGKTIRATLSARLNKDHVTL